MCNSGERKQQPSRSPEGCVGMEPGVREDAGRQVRGEPIPEDRTRAFKGVNAPIFQGWRPWRSRPPQNHTARPHPSLPLGCKLLKMCLTAQIATDSPDRARHWDSALGVTGGSRAADSRKWGAAAGTRSATPPQSAAPTSAPPPGPPGRGRGSRSPRPAQGPRARPARNGGGQVRAAWDPSPPFPGGHQPSGVPRPRPTFDARHGGDVAPGSTTQAGAGGRETEDARPRPDNTRKCASQHFRRRLALARGRGERASSGRGRTPSSLRSSGGRPRLPDPAPTEAWGRAGVTECSRGGRAEALCPRLQPSSARREREWPPSFEEGCLLGVVLMCFKAHPFLPPPRSLVIRGKEGSWVAALGSSVSYAEPGLW
jgi:hypothetical protein